MSDDPIRLRDDPKRAALLRDDLRVVATVTPAVVDLAAGLAKLESSLDRAEVTSGAGSAAGAVGSSTPAAGLLWVGGVVGLAGIVVAALAFTTRHDTTDRSHVSVQAPRRGTPEDATTTIPSQGVTPSSAALPSPAATPDPPVVEARPRRHSSARPAETSTSDAAEVDIVSREIELVGRARGQLAADPAAALATTETARNESPDGPLAEEREALAILALHALGRRQEARRRAADYLLRWPAGAQSARIQRVQLDEGEEP